MSFLVSPGVNIREIDIRTIIPNVDVSSAGTVGEFRWGSVEEINYVNNPDQLKALFAEPSTTIYKDFLISEQFLSYANNLQVVRVVEDDALNATCLGEADSNGSFDGVGQLIKNVDSYESTAFTASENLFVAKYPGEYGNNIGVAWADTTTFNAVDSNGNATWTFANLFTDAPDSNEFHIVVYDATGEITGTINTVLEIFEFVSTSETALKFDGTSAYVKNVLQNESAWIYIGNVSLLTGGNAGISLAGGADGASVTDASRQTGFDLFRDSESVDISIIFQGAGGTTTGSYIINSIAEFRKDCVACVSPLETDVVNINNEATILSNILATRTIYGTSTYAIMDSAYKYVYDRYNNVYRWIPLNGDIAGLMARTDTEFDPWFSPAGFTRGRIKNVVKFSHKQPENIRDELYKKGVNPCVVFKNEGAVLFGDKTLQTKPSSFDRINVRRLFIVLEKSIATAARANLFDQNDEFTRNRFVNTVEPFLREVQGRRGIDRFAVVCNESNNPDSVVSRNEFVASIFIKPVTSINFITLNFVSTSSGVQFEEVVQTGTF